MKRCKLDPISIGCKEQTCPYRNTNDDDPHKRSSDPKGCKSMIYDRSL